MKNFPELLLSGAMLLISVAVYATASESTTASTSKSKSISASDQTHPTLGTIDNSIEVIVNGQKLRFGRLGNFELELLPGDYTGNLVIPAGFYYQWDLYTVTSIGRNSLSSPGIRSVTVPHTVRSLFMPFGYSSSTSPALDSIRFMSRPLHFQGDIPPGVVKKMVRKVPDLKYGDKWSTEAFTVARTISQFHLVGVRYNKTGKLGLATYDIAFLPFEYDSYDSFHHYEGDDYTSYGIVMKKDGEWGMVAPDNKVLIPFKYDSPEKMGTWERVDKKMHRAFGKLYGAGAKEASEKVEEWLESAKISYLMRLASYKEEKSGAENNNDFLDSFFLTFDEEEFERRLNRPYVLEKRIDSLAKAGNFTEAKAVYREYVKEEGFSPDIEELFGRLGIMTHDREITRDMRWLSERYSGETDEFGLPHGMGKFVTISDVYDFWFDDDPSYEDTYTGLWIKGKMYGNQKVERSLIIFHEDGIDSVKVFSADAYMAGNTPVGDVTIEYADEKSSSGERKTYKGSISSDWEPEGYGKGTGFNGVTYSGFWKDGHFHGRGRVEYPDGRWLEGIFDNGKFSLGKGSITYSDGSRYEGEMKDGSPHGKGKITFANGSFYEGELKDGIPHGKGREVTDHTILDGEFEEGKFLKGYGLIHYDNGDVYEGGFENNEYNGHGKLTYPDGNSMEGNFRNGMPHGDFIFRDKYGNTRKTTIGSPRG